MLIPTTRQIEIFEGIAPQIDALLDDWLDRPEFRRTPLTPQTTRIVGRVLSTTRDFVSRMPDAWHVEPLPKGEVMPVDAFLSLLMARGALAAFQELHARDSPRGWRWNEEQDGLCRVCRGPLEHDTNY
jgi:hypothetical protein